jgi:hypothetical protein
MMINVWLRPILLEMLVLARDFLAFRSEVILIVSTCQRTMRWEVTFRAL